MYDINEYSWSDSYPGATQYLIKHCPVCKNMFKLDPDGDMIGSCDECRADFYFTKHQTLPYKNQLYSQKPKVCHCASCGGKDDD